MVNDQVHLAWYGDDVARYDHGPRHPLRLERVSLTRRLIQAYGLLDGRRVLETPGRDATDDELQLVHTPEYVDAVRRAGHGEAGPWGRYGFGPGDNPVFPRMHEASARVVGTSLAAAQAVLSGPAIHAFNPAGGLHHAMPARASGFCVYDDPAIAIAWLLANGATRVAYVDVDVHHGDGPQAIFFDDPRVLTISLHQSGNTLFPGTGFVTEAGAGDAFGTKVNVPLPPSTGDATWLSAFRQVVPPLVEAWRPDVLVTQLGCDTHATDPLAGVLLTTRAYRETAAILHGLAHSAAGGRWLATGGGGYQWATVVPRAWTIYFAEMANVEVAADLPGAWVGQARAESGEDVPSTLWDADSGGDFAPERPSVTEAVERAVDDVRRQIFPAHGL